MSTNNMDDLIPRPLPKPSQIEEMSVRPEVPEVSLVFDSASGNSDKIQSPLSRYISSMQPLGGSLLDTNHFIPRAEHHYSSLTNPKSPNPSLLTSSTLRTPLKLDDRGVLAAKKVSFSPHGLKNDTNVVELNVAETQQNKNENPACHCNHDTQLGPQHNHNFKNTPDDKKSCLCSSYSNDLDYSWDHSASVQRILKNLERKINTKVSYDDLQKTELKIENILLKHKCKYDKLGENCVTREEFNRIIKNYESQVNLLQLRVEELTQKLSYSSHFVGATCNREIKKCSCADDLVHRKSPPKQVANPVKCLNHNCCPSLPISNGNLREDGKNYLNADTVIPTNNRRQFNVQTARTDNQELQLLKNCYQNCYRDQENFKSADHRDPLRMQDRNLTMENHIMIQTANTHSSPEHNNQTPPSVYKTNTTQIIPQQPQHHSNQPQNFPRDHHPMLNERNDDQLLSTEKNIRLDWTFYNNIVEDVKNLMQNSTKSPDSNADTVELIKKATVEQLHKMGINLDHRIQNERISPNDNQNNKFIPTNPAASPDLSFHLNSVAMKYASEPSPEGEYRKITSASDNRKSPANDVSFRSNCNNVSIATLQYMERYQLLPNSEQRYGGNSAGFNKYEQNGAQEHRHRFQKPNHYNDRNSDRSLIY